jgi:hypothetical protein
VHGVTDVSDTLVTAVDFPSFVAGLIKGVFNTIVDASISQMDDYIELVKNVAQTVSRFLQDPISEGDGCRFLAAKYSKYLLLDPDPDPDCHKVRLRDHVDKAEATDRFSCLPLGAPLRTLDQGEVDRILVPSGRRRLAVQRQQLVASMVLMGINRIIVTNGTVPAA